MLVKCKCEPLKLQLSKSKNHPDGIRRSRWYFVAASGKCSSITTLAGNVSSSNSNVKVANVVTLHDRQGELVACPSPATVSQLGDDGGVRSSVGTHTIPYRLLCLPVRCWCCRRRCCCCSGVHLALAQTLFQSHRIASVLATYLGFSNAQQFKIRSHDDCKCT